MQSSRYVILVCLVFLASCGAINPGGSSQPTDEDSRKGVGELEYKFFKDAPPREMNQYQIYDAVLELDNQGAADIETGYISLITEQQYLSVIGIQQQRFSLEGQNKFNPEGESKTVRFTLEAKELNRQSQRLETEILANVCYDYQTIFTDVVCLHPDPYSDSIDQDICTPKDLTSSGQGAPIAIEKVTMSIPNSGDSYMQPIFSIHIKNKRGGIPIIKSRTRDLCTNAPLPDGTLNTLSIFATLGERQLDCGGFTVSLKKGEGTIRCTDTIGVLAADGPYLTPLYISLGYGYSETISQKVSIVR